MLAGRRDRFAHWLLLSALIHALGALWLGVARRAAPFVPPAPLVLTVRVVAGPPAQKPPAGPPAPIAPPVAAPPPAPSKPQAPPRPPPSRKPVAKQAEPVAPVPAAPSAPAPSVAAPVESAATAGSASTAGVAAGPALGALGTAAAVGPAAPTPAALDSYIALVHRAIEAHKSYPALARRRGIEGSVTVRIAIDPSGALELTELVGFAPEILARATREAVERAKPFPPPPHGALRLEIPVRYEIDE